MAGLALPKFRWLIFGAMAAGAWVVYQDMKVPRPPAKVQQTRSTAPAPKKPVASRHEEAKPRIALHNAERPVPPAPVGAKPAQKAENTTQQRTALALPKAVERPPVKPQQIVTSSIGKKPAENRPVSTSKAGATGKPAKHIFVQTRTKVQMHAQARRDAAVIATLEPRTVMRELARSGDWRLVMGDGRKGWIHSRSLAQPTFLPRRPKLPVTDVRQAKADPAPRSSTTKPTTR